MQLIYRIVWLVAALALNAGRLVQAETPPAQAKSDNVAKLLKIADPDIEALKKIDYSHVDLSKVDPATKTSAIMAVNKLLSIHGERARARVEMLEDYVQAKGLNDAFSRDSTAVPERKLMSLDDGVRLAVALVQTPEGQAEFGKDFEGMTPAELERTYSAYYNLCLKNWGEVAYRRFRVQELASFLDSKGLLNDFISWAKAEKVKQKKERDEAMAKRRAEQKVEEDKARGQRLAAYNARVAKEEARAEKGREREHEKYMKRLEYATEVDTAEASRPTYYYAPWW